MWSDALVLSASFLRALEQKVGHQGTRFSLAGAGREFEDFGAIERIREFHGYRHGNRRSRRGRKSRNGRRRDGRRARGLLRIRRAIQREADEHSDQRRRARTDLNSGQATSRGSRRLRSERGGYCRLASNGFLRQCQQLFRTELHFELGLASLRFIGMHRSRHGVPCPHLVFAVEGAGRHSCTGMRAPWGLCVINAVSRPLCSERRG